MAPAGPKTKARKARNPAKKSKTKKATGKKATKPTARTDDSQYIAFNYNGLEMNVKERNERMGLEYVRGMTIEEIAHRYGLAVITVKKACAAGGWVERRKAFQANQKLVSDDTLTQLYAGFKININIKYHAAWEKLMQIIEQALDNPEKYLMNSDGTLRWGALDVLSNIIDRAQRGQERANGAIPAEVRYRLDMEREKITLLRSRVEAGEGPDELSDNFIEALDEAAKNVWAEFEETTGAYIKNHK